MQHFRPTLTFKPLIPLPPILYLIFLLPHYRLLLLVVSLHLLFPLPPDFLRVLQWNAGDLLARTTKLLHFISSHSVDLICIQESNLNSSSSFQIPGFSTLRSDGILSLLMLCMLAVGVIIFVRQGLSFLELFTFSLSSLHPYSDYVGVNIFLNQWFSKGAISPLSGRTFS